MKPGEHVDVAVLGVDLPQRRISLSLKQTLPDPWESIAEKFVPNTTVDATVTSLTDFGAFAEIDSDIEGLVRNADLSWTKKVKHPSESLKKGQKIKAMVLSVDAEHRRPGVGPEAIRARPLGRLLRADSHWRHGESQGRAHGPLRRLRRN